MFIILAIYMFFKTHHSQVSLRNRFEGPGQILILPTTFEPGDEAAFTFRVFSRSSGLRMKVRTGSLREYKTRKNI